MDKRIPFIAGFSFFALHLSFFFVFSIHTTPIMFLDYPFFILCWFIEEILHFRMPNFLIVFLIIGGGSIMYFAIGYGIGKKLSKACKNKEE